MSALRVPLLDVSAIMQLRANELWSFSVRGAPDSSAVPLQPKFLVPALQRADRGWSCGGCKWQTGGVPELRDSADRGSTGCR